jgi:hypothetical protein
MSWFRVDEDMVDHPKTHMLGRRLAETIESKPDPVGVVIRMWSWMSRFCPTGHVTACHVTAFGDALATSLGLQGAAQKLTDALCDTGWLERDSDGAIEAHDWEQKQHKVASKAEKDRVRQREYRAKKKAERSQTVTRDMRDSHVVTNSDVTPLRDGTRRDGTEEKKPMSTCVDGGGLVLDLQDPASPPKSPAVKLEEALSDDAFQVWEHWRQVLHPKARLDSKRRKLIELRLRDYSVAELQAAIDGCAKSPHHQGQNDSHTRYDDLELILRDAKHVEQFLEVSHAG